MRSDEQQRLQEVMVGRLAPRLRAAFADSLTALRAALPARRLAREIAARGPYAGLRLLDEALAAEPFRPLEAALGDAIAGAGRRHGAALATTFVRKREPWSFRPLDAANVAAARALIDSTINYLKATARAAALAVVLAGAPAGRTPGQLARDVLASLGLSERQAQGAEAYRQGLAATARAAEPQPTRTVARARLEESARERLVERHRRRASLARAELLATDQARRAASLAVQQVWEQASRDGLIDPARTLKRWVHVGDARVRDTHRSIPTLNPGGVPLDGVFRSSSGAFLRWPHDPLAPIAETASCRCVLSYSLARAS